MKPYTPKSITELEKAMRRNDKIAIILLSILGVLLVVDITFTFFEIYKLFNTYK